MLSSFPKLHPLATRALRPLATRAFLPLATRAFRPTPVKSWTRSIHDFPESGTDHHSHFEPSSEKHPERNEEAVEEDLDATKGDDIKQRIGILEGIYKHVVCKGQANLQRGIQEVKAEITETRKEMKADFMEVRKDMKHDMEVVRKEARTWFLFVMGTVICTVGVKFLYYDSAQKKDMQKEFGKQLSASQKEVEGKIGEIRSEMKEIKEALKSRSWFRF